MAIVKRPDKRGWWREAWNAYRAYRAWGFIRRDAVALARAYVQHLAASTQWR